MKILIDMNLPPRWVQFFARVRWHAVHWSSVGAPNATDREVLAWAQENGHVVFTHDLDLPALAAAIRGNGPNIIQVRALDILPESIGKLVAIALKQYKKGLAKGAIITIDPHLAQVRVTPYNS